MSVQSTQSTITFMINILHERSCTNAKYSATKIFCYVLFFGLPTSSYNQIFIEYLRESFLFLKKKTRMNGRKHNISCFGKIDKFKIIHDFFSQICCLAYVFQLSKIQSNQTTPTKAIKKII